MDYREPGTFDIIFTPESPSLACIEVEIISDSNIETNETFIIEMRPGKDIIPGNATIVTILDNDGNFLFSAMLIVISVFCLVLRPAFELTQYVVIEDVGQRVHFEEVCLRHNQTLQLERDVVVTIQTIDGSATGKLTL